MPHTALIAGAQAPLVSALAARYLACTDDTVMVAALPGTGPSADEYRALVLEAAGRMRPHAVTPARLRTVALADCGGHPFLANTIWCLAAGYAGADPRLALRTDSATARALLARAVGSREFRYVGPSRLDDPAAVPVIADVVSGYRQLEREIAERRRAAALEHAIIRACPVIDVPYGSGELTTGLPHLLASLDWLRTYVTARYAGYFQALPVRLLAAPGGTLDVLPAAHAASLLLRFQPGMADGAGELSGRVLTLPADMADSAETLRTFGACLGLDLVVTADEAELNPVDRLLADRLGGFTALLTTPVAAPGGGGAGAVAGLAMLASAASAASAASGTSGAAPRSEPADGPVCFDSGPTDAATLVIVNALGQGPGYWRRLLALLSRRHRVILFQPGGSRPDGQPATGDDQLAAIADVLAARRVRECHLLGWCTGAKTVLRYYLRHPDQVRSLALLTPAFKHPGRPACLDTDYERYLESMANLLATRPALAPRMLHLFSGIFDTSRVDGDIGPADLPDVVLATPDPAMDAERRRPFATTEDLLRYGRQLFDFWADDVLPDAARVRVPALLITASHDEIVSADGVLAAAARFPHARHARISGATHFCMHDRPDAVGAVVEELIAARSCAGEAR